MALKESGAEYIARLRATIDSRKKRAAGTPKGAPSADNDQQLKNAESNLKAERERTGIKEGEVIPFPKPKKPEPKEYKVKGEKAFYGKLKFKDAKKIKEEQEAKKMVPLSKGKRAIATLVKNKTAPKDSKVWNSNRKEEYNMSESVKNIIDLIISGGPADVKPALETAITEKIAAALEGRKAIIANGLVGIGESKKENEPSWVHLAMDKIKKNAKNEGVDMSDEDAETILEALLEDNTETVTKETLDYVREWFTEEELNEWGNSGKSHEPIGFGNKKYGVVNVASGRMKTKTDLSRKQATSQSKTHNFINPKK